MTLKFGWYIVAEEFTLMPMRRLLAKHGNLRISESAAYELRRVLGDYGSKVAEKAVKNARNEGRKTVLDRDIVAALLEIKGDSQI